MQRKVTEGDNGDGRRRVWREVWKGKKRERREGGKRDEPLNENQKRLMPKNGKHVLLSLDTRSSLVVGETVSGERG